MTQNVILCDGGVDLMAQRVGADPGTLRGCLNYEVDTERGYKSIQGFARYDGRAYPNKTIATKLVALTSTTGTFEVGENLQLDGEDFAVIRATDNSTEWVIQPLNSIDPASGDTVTGKVSGATGLWPSSTLTPATGYSYTTAAEWLTVYEDMATDQRNAVKWCGGTPLGVHYFRDAAWVIRNNTIAYILTDIYEKNSETRALRTLNAGEYILITETKGVSTLTEYIGKIISFHEVENDVGQDPNTVHLEVEYVGAGLNTQGDSAPDTGTNKGVEITPLYRCKFSSGSTTPDYASDTFDSGAWVIEEIQIDSGDWSGGDAAGTMWIREVSSPPSVASFTGSSSGTTFDIDQVKQGSPYVYKTDDAEVGEFSDGLGSQLIKDTGAGWESIDMGYEVQFDTGTNEPSTLFDLIVAQTDSSSATTDAGWHTASKFVEVSDGPDTWETNAGSEDPPDIVAAVGTDDANYIEATTNLSVPGVYQETRSILLKDFGIDIGENATIAGVQVEIIARESSTADVEWSEVRLVLPDGTESNNKAVEGKAVPTSFTTETIGAEGDNWGANLTAKKVEDSNFGLRIQFRSDANSGVPEVQVDFVRLKIWTRPATETVYFYDGSSDVATAELIYAQRTSGAWADNDAAGVATIRNIQTGDVVSGLSVYTGASATGDLLFNTTSSAQKNTLPSKAEIDAAGSRYQFIDENFYARESLRAVFGVSGAGYAFAFTEDYFFRIRAGFADQEVDTPRHIAKHGDRLMLGYSTGECIFSGVGEPINFESTAGASDSFGSPIYGLIPMTGESTAVLTRDEVVVLQGREPATWVKNRIDSDSGSIEYTAADMGIPIYLDSRGVSTINAADKYGDFQRGRLSYRVESWLRPRIQRLLSGADESSRPVTAIPIRSKSQYLVLFADGYAMSVTFIGDELPQCMFRQYKVFTENADFVAVGEGKTSSGQDRVFFSASNSGYLYEFNQGHSFDGNGFDLSLEMNATWMDPRKNWRGLVVHIFGELEDQGTLSVATISDHEHEAPQDRVILRSDTKDHNDDKTGFYAQARMKTRGVNIALKLSRSAAIKPVHTIQAYQWARPNEGREER